MSPAEAPMGQHGIGVRGEVAIGKEQQLDRLAQLLVGVLAGRLRCRHGLSLHLPLPWSGPRSRIMSVLLTHLKPNVSRNNGLDVRFGREPGS